MNEAAKIAELERKVERITRALDPFLRAHRLPPLIDDQVQAINANMAGRIAEDDKAKAEKKVA